MILRKDSWTHVEDEMIIETMTSFARDGKKQKEALAFLEELLSGRTYNAINNRWQKFLKFKVIGNPLYQEITSELPSLYQPLDLKLCMDLLNCTHLDKENKEIINDMIRNHIKKGD